MKQHADKKRTERSFSVGDQVWLKLQPYVQTSVASRASHKLSFHYFGPYTIECKVGSVAYKLKLPPSRVVHPVFHVSLLKKVIGKPPSIVSPLPLDDSTMQEPECVLDKRLKSKMGRVVSQVLLKWVGWPPELATWDDEDQIQRLLAPATTCGQAIFQGRGNVKSKEVTSDSMK